jgi:CRP/FNR family transcriptional regulator
MGSEQSTRKAEIPARDEEAQDRGRAGIKVRHYCDRCPVRTQALCGGLPSDAATDLSRIAHCRRIPAGQIIHSGHQNLSWFAVIVSGVVKLVKAQSDGRQQIVGLQFPGDFLGRPYALSRSVTAEATTNLELCCFSKNAFEQLLAEHPAIEHVLHRRSLDDLDASRDWMFLLGRKTAREKLATLLNLMAGRMARQASRSAKGDGTLAFDLPLSRMEMADFLGLSTETVSRELRYLKSASVIATRGRRHVVVSDLECLKSIAESEQE